jgi:hypothetical protein
VAQRARDRIDAGYHQPGDWADLITALARACRTADAQAAATAALREYPGQQFIVAALKDALALAADCPVDP